MIVVRSLVDKSEEFYDVGHPDKQVAHVFIGDIGEVATANVLSYPLFPPIESFGRSLILWPHGMMLMGFSEIEIL